MMYEYKENIKLMTKEDVISLSNMEKRQKFAENYQSWGVWLDIPQLQVKVYKAVLPEGQSLVVTEYQTNFGRRGVYRYIDSNHNYTPNPDCISVIAHSLKDLKVKYCKEIRKEKNRD